MSLNHFLSQSAENKWLNPRMNSMILDNGLDMKSSNISNVHEINGIIFPNLPSGNFVMTEGDQIINGNKTFTSNIIGSITGNANSVTDGVYTIGDQTIGGNKTFSSNIIGSIIGNASTVTNGVYIIGDQNIGGNKTFSLPIIGSVTGSSGSVTNGVYTIGDQTIGGNKTFSLPIIGSITGNASSVTNGVYTVGDQIISGNKTFSSNIIGSITGNAVTVTNGVYTISDQTIGGNKTFSLPIIGSITGNAATVTNGVYTSGSYADPSWITSLSASKLTGLVSLANGGLNANLTASNGGIFYSSASSGAILAGVATANKVLMSGASGAPSWSTPTYPSTSGSSGQIIRSDGTNNIYSTATYPDTLTANNILFASSSNVVSGLATTNNGILITSGAGVPSISSTLPSAVQSNITSIGSLSQVQFTLNGTNTTTYLNVNCNSAGGTAAVNLSRPDVNSYSNIYYKTASSFLWSAGMQATSSDYFIVDQANGNNQLRLTSSASVANSQSIFGGLLTCGNDLTINNGNCLINTAGKTLKIKSGTNACAGTGAVLVAGIVTINTTAVATGDIVLLTRTTSAGVLGFTSVTIINGTSFTILSSSALDTSTFSWAIIKPF